MNEALTPLSNLAASADQVRKPGSIEISLDHLNSAIEDLSKTVTQHENHISPILAPVPPQNEGLEKNEEASTDLGRALTNFRDKILAITQHIRTIDGRVEL